MMALAERELASPAQDTEQGFTPQPYRWTREQFYEMGDLGLFEGRRAILVEGEILALPAMGNLHHQAVVTLTLASDVASRSVWGRLLRQCPRARLTSAGRLIQSRTSRLFAAASVTTRATPFNGSCY